MTKYFILRWTSEAICIPIIIMNKDLLPENPRPVCFGDEAKFVTYMEAPAGDAECASCPSENECGEFILFKCSRELTF